MRDSDIINAIVDTTVGCSISTPSPAADAYIASRNAELVHAVEARRLPLTDRTFAAPPPPSPGQRCS